MERAARRDLEVLDAVAEDQRITQRSLASKLGIALGLSNIYLKRLAHKGYIKCVNVRPNRILYLITPTGIAEKTRLTYEFMEYSLHLYRDVRQRLRTALGPLADSDQKRVAIYGRGEVAELAYLSLKELELDPVAIFDGRGEGLFLGIPVKSVYDQHLVAYDRLILATLEGPADLISHLVREGVPREKLLTLRESEGAEEP